MIQHCKYCDSIIHGRRPEDFVKCPFCQAIQNTQPPVWKRTVEEDEDFDPEKEKLKKEVEEWKEMCREALKMKS